MCVILFKTFLYLQKIKAAIMKTAAFFDLDNTIIKANTGIVWGKYMLLKGVLPFRFFLAAGFYGFMYKLGVYPFGKLIQKSFATVKGKDARKVISLTQDCFEGKKKKLYRRKLVEAIKWHQSQKHDVVIMTQTFDFIAKIFADDLGIKHLFSTEIEIKNGKFTGSSKPCIGHMKDDLMREFASQRHIDLSKSYAYTDSIRDLEMLEGVGHKYAINPRLKLKHIAKREDWNIWKFRRIRKNKFK
jgi:putative phosphoserine phosphatase/1-acylglycerol-3-phosphate O-acyltransferase